jgi:glutamyl-tRNA reductase
VAWLNSRGAVPTVVALRQRFESIRQSELRRLEPKLAGLGPDARAKVDEITRLLVEKLLINPTEQLKSLSDADTVAAYSDALNRLFDLSGHEGRPARELGEPGEDETANAGPVKKRVP